MSTRVEVTRAFSDLERHVYQFCQYDLQVRLDRFLHEKRQSKRHGWKMVSQYYRLNSRGNDVKSVRIPVDVMDEAVSKYQWMLKFVPEQHEVVA